MSKKIKIEKNELEILVNNGFTQKQISEILRVSLATIKRYFSKYSLKSKFYESKRETVICLECKNKFSSTIKENRKFCSHSCSATFNNRKNDKIGKIIGKCINCEKELIKNNGKNFKKYCSVRCQVDFITNKNIKENKASSKTVKRFLIKKYGSKCMKCGWAEINEYSNKVPIELEHIDGNSENNELENLILLCPNCHSLTPTYKALNKGNGRHKRMERYKDGKSY